MGYRRGKPVLEDDGVLVAEQRCEDCDGIGSEIHKEVWWVGLLQLQWMARRKAVVQPKN